MPSLMEALSQRALDAGVPLGVHLDLTWRCNERCVHCYLDHEGDDELTLPELRRLLDEMAAAGVFFVTFSGGEIFLRRDLERVVEHARSLSFDIKLKTNAMTVGAEQAAWIRRLGVHQVQVSVYSSRPEIHDAITKVRGSLGRTIDGIGRLRAAGVKVVIACVLMKQNAGEFEGVRRLAAEYGAEFTLDPTITPHLDDYGALLDLNIGPDEMAALYRDPTLIDPAPATSFDAGMLDSAPCSAGHTSCYISPRGEVWPCVQFPVVCGNVRESRFADIWNHSARLREIRAIRLRDLTTCSSCGHAGSCSRCPGLAFMEGNMYGPSTADCGKSFARTGVPSESMVRGTFRRQGRLDLVQISV